MNVIHLGKAYLMMIFRHAETSRLGAPKHTHDVESNAVEHIEASTNEYAVP